MQSAAYFMAHLSSSLRVLLVYYRSQSWQRPEADGKDPELGLGLGAGDYPTACTLAAPPDRARSGAPRLSCARIALRPDSLRR